MDTSTEIPLANLSALKVTLRWNGVNIAQGEAYLGELNTPKATPFEQTQSPTLKLAQISINKALDESKSTLRAAHYHAASDNNSKQLPPPMTFRELAPRLQVDLQIALSPKPIRIVAAKNRKAIYQQFVPGYHALRMTSPTDPKLTAWTWPADIIATNTSQWSQLIQLLTQTGQEIGDLPKIARAGGPSLERFNVIHITQTSADTAPTLLIRGTSPHPPHSISDNELEEIAKRLTAYLLIKQREDGQFAGTYFPSLDQYNPPIAPAQDHALAAYALLHRANYVKSQLPDHPQQQQAIQGARQAVLHLIKNNAPASPVYEDPPIAALILACIAEDPTLAGNDHQQIRKRLTDQLLELQQDSGDFKLTTDQPAPPQGLILLALTSAYERTHGPNILKAIFSARTAIWQDTDPTKLLKRLPWQALAELRIRRAFRSSTDLDITHTLDEHTHQLHQLIETLKSRQIKSVPDNQPDDVVGGFNFRTTSSPPIPDWNSARVLLFLSEALKDNQLTKDHDTLGLTLTCGLAARFIKQLMFDRDASYYIRSQSDTLGGIKLSPVDNRLAIGPAAISLLAVTELQNALSEIAPRININTQQNP